MNVIILSTCKYVDQQVASSFSQACGSISCKLILPSIWVNKLQALCYLVLNTSIIYSVYPKGYTISSGIPINIVIILISFMLMWQRV
uniref:Uncharacterized protein n=1 Tax=Cannabis sativa TaxID=3483 RepID=A0A803QZM1_CANSA